MGGLTMVVCGVAGRPVKGQHMSGDAHVLAPFGGGTLIAALDGLGHGPDAAAAVGVAIQVIVRCAAAPVSEIIVECHKALTHTRGAAVTLASFRDADRTMSWIAIGNVEGVLLRPTAGSKKAREHVLMRGGIVGHNLPSPRSSTLTVEPMDTVILATDGIRADFTEGLDLTEEPTALAHTILAGCARPDDDALVLVARYAEEA